MCFNVLWRFKFHTIPFKNWLKLEADTWQEQTKFFNRRLHLLQIVYLNYAYGFKM